MSTEMLNFNQIETYLECPQKWEYKDTLKLQPEENTQSFDRRQELLRIALLTVYRSSENAGEAARKAMGFVDRNWERFTDDGLYLSERQEEFDKSVTKQALRTYLENYWDEHLSSVVERGGTTGVQIEGRNVKTELDLLNERSDGTLVAYRYVPTLHGVSFSPSGEDKAKQYLDRDEYTGRYLASILRAELAIRGVAEDQDVDTADVRYVVIGLHDSVTTAAGSGGDGVSIEPGFTELTDWHEEFGVSNCELLEDIVRRIDRSNTTIPEEWKPDLLESTCRYCGYKDMCKPRFNWEIEF